MVTAAQEPGPEHSVAAMERKVHVVHKRRGLRFASFVSELHVSVQVLVGRLHDAVYMLPGRNAGTGATARATVSASGYAADLLEAGRRFEELVSCLPADIRQRNDNNFRSTLSELERADEDVSKELTQLVSRLAALQHEVSNEMQKTCVELCGASVSHKQSPAIAKQGAPADQVVKDDAVVPRLQDLLQEKPRRFVEELEFVECLANPDYTHWLATQHYFDDEAFVGFCQYLHYWRGPPHVYYVQHLAALRMLEMLAKPHVRAAVQRMDVRGFLAKHLMLRWAGSAEVRLDSSGSGPAGVSPLRGAPTAERTRAPRRGTEVLRECDVMQDWTTLEAEGLLADKAWHVKLAALDSSVCTVQMFAERIGKNYLGKAVESKQQLEDTFRKYQHTWRCSGGASDVSQVLANLHAEVVPKGLNVTLAALKRVIWSLAASATEYQALLPEHRSGCSSDEQARKRPRLL